MNHVPFKGEKNIDSLLKFDIIYFGDLRLDLRSIEKDRQEIFVSIINPILISHTLLGAKSLVCCLEELDSSETKKKQFRFWVYSSRIVNPTEFVVELTNPNAGSDVSMSEFLENAEVNYLSKGNIII